MNPIKNLKVGDIMISDLVYYEESIKKECAKFCKRLGISSMPSLDRKSYYSRNGEEFKEEKTLFPEKHFRINDLLFDENTIEKFKVDKDNVLFVLDDFNKIVGVIHISDYNSEKLYLHFYKYMMSFERKLRTFLKSKGYNNKHFIEYIEKELPDNYKRYFSKKSSKKHKEMSEKIANLADFEAFYLSDLLEFANAKLNTEISDDVRKLRNWVSHFSSAVGFELEQEDENKILYSIQNLADFKNRVEAFCEAYEKIELKLLQQINKEKIEKMISQYGKS